MSVKRHMRPIIDRAAEMSGVLGRYEARMRGGLTILMYHRVLPDPQCVDYPLPSLVMPKSAFRSQIHWLTEHCRVLPVEEALKEGRTGVPSDVPRVAISFDDGYADNYEHVLPILREAGVRATFFVTAGLIGTDAWLWFDRAMLVARQWARRKKDEPTARKRSEENGARRDVSAWLTSLKTLGPAERETEIERVAFGAQLTDERRSYRLMDWDQVRELAETGHEIGSHSCSHPILPTLDEKSLEYEVGDARRRIAEQIGRNPAGFCYPNGDCDDRVKGVVRRAGYSYACSTTPGLNDEKTDRLALKRVDITARHTLNRRGEHDPVGFRAEISRLRAALR